MAVPRCQKLRVVVVMSRLMADLARKLKLRIMCSRKGFDFLPQVSNSINPA